ncbi:uncharacterized protein LOC134695013 [Mytilus trossulus]|uniref:uncharacterized protein LOC134695013 n=1 Tax=Mytilus trossulus TaxID=6551 RepID=UPI003004575F
MNVNVRNQDKSDDENLFGIKKTTYWQIYGVKRFPYRGKRKFTPLLYPSLDGGMVISNDVFGLTISQFERMYKACLERRKTKEQWILNLRYPDKSSKEYLEFLENCTECNEDHLLWSDQREKYLYDNLIKTVGSEIDIRKRQRLFIIQDMIVNLSGSINRTQIFSGSLSEGFDLPGSDIDVMFALNNYRETKNVKNVKDPIHRTALYIMETDIDHPGFARVRIVSQHNGVSLREQCSRCPPGTCTGSRFYLTANSILQDYKKQHPYAVCIHGPCISDEDQTFDFALCLRSKYFPQNAIPWASRHRWHWPSSLVCDRIINSGCFLVPIGPKTSTVNDDLWRVSFSVAEKLLVHSFNLTQLLCYGLLKLTLKRIINTNDELKDLLCSYFLKTALFWVSGEVDIDTFQLSKIYHCFSLCLDKLILWVNTCYCPNYFIPEHNMFLGKIDQTNNKIVLGVLESIQCRGIDGLIQNIFPLDNDHNYVLSTKSESSFISLDFLLHRTVLLFQEHMRAGGITNLYKACSCIDALLKSESSTFIIEACIFYHAKISEIIVKRLPSPNTKGNTFNIRKLYHRLFKHIIKIDAVSGWLLYASFYYVTGQFNDTLRITDYVLSKYSPYLMLIDSDSTVKNNDVPKNNYRHTVQSSMTLKERLIIGTAQHVHYDKHSPLIPDELQLEVKDRIMNILPNVMCHCFRFLCFHHLGNISKRREALSDLYTSVKHHNIISINTESNSLIILGVCFEMSDDKDMAYQCYEEALQCKLNVFYSAEARKSNLLI